MKKPDNQNHPSVLLKDYEVAKILNCSKSSVHRWAASGEIPSPIKIGNGTRWIRQEISDVIADKASSRVLGQIDA